MKELYFVRHGETEWNAIRRMQGQWNSDLNELGKEQARINAELLQQLGIEAMFASPLDRTRQTAAIINEHIDVPVIFDDRIMEWDCGDWSGHLYDEVRAQWPMEWEALQSDHFHYRAPNGENYPDMFRRARPFVDELLSMKEDRIAIVSHGMIGKVMTAIVLGLGEEETLSVYQPNDVILLTTINGEDITASHFVGGIGPIPGLHVRQAEQSA